MTRANSALSRPVSSEIAVRLGLLRLGRGCRGLHSGGVDLASDIGRDALDLLDRRRELFGRRLAAADGERLDIFGEGVDLGLIFGCLSLFRRADGLETVL